MCYCLLLPFPVSYMTDIPNTRARQSVMQPLNCLSLLLGLAILSATLGPFVAIAHRELLMVTSSERGLETKLELSVDKTSTNEEIRSNVLTGRKMSFGDAVLEKDAKDARSKPRSGEIKNYSTNSHAPPSLKDSTSSRMTAGPFTDSIKLEGSTSELVLNIPKPQHIRTLPSKPSSRNPSSGSKKELKDSIVRNALYKINEDWKEKMIEASDEILKLLNKDYHASPRRRTPVHN